MECSATLHYSTLVATRVDSLAFCDVRFLLKVFIIVELLKFLQTNRTLAILNVRVCVSSDRSVRAMSEWVLSPSVRLFKFG